MFRFLLDPPTIARSKCVCVNVTCGVTIPAGAARCTPFYLTRGINAKHVCYRSWRLAPIMMNDAQPKNK